MSHPVWVCGLKQTMNRKIRYANAVTPCMGVWIETALRQAYAAQKYVTPCMGVWIETIKLAFNSLNWFSHTLYGCVD